MIPAPAGYLAHFRDEHGDELVREVLAFDDGGSALVVDEVGGRLVPVTQLGDGWQFLGLASSPRRRQFEFEGVIREVDADEAPAAEDDDPRWCEARPPEPEQFCEEQEDEDEEVSSE